MSFDSLNDVNWLAVIVGTLVYFALGGFWYSPAGFGKTWMRSIGMEQPPPGQRPNASVYASPLIAGLVAAIATVWLAHATGSSTVGEGALLGLVIGVGYMVTLASTTATFSQFPEPKTWFWVTASYNVVGMTILGIIVSAWH